GETEIASERQGAVTGAFRAAAHVVLGQHSAPGAIGGGVMDPELRSATPAGPVCMRGRLLGDLEAHLVPPAHGADELGTGVVSAAPRHLGTQQATAHMLLLPANASM